ncbi:MAG: DUF4405 domain-containing protein [Balneolaceae bacterium]
MAQLRKHSQNVIIDYISFVCFGLLVITGFLLHLKLPAGSHNATLIGYNRHQWGEFHFWVAIIFIVGIIVHLILHIPWIKSTLSTNKGEKQRFILLLFSFTVYTILLFSLGVLLTPIIK